MTETKNQHVSPGALLALSQMLTGYWTSQAVYVAAKLGIADGLANGAKNSRELASLTGAHAPTLHRLLRALESLGVLADAGEGRFTLTPLGSCLRSGAAGSLRSLAITLGEEHYVAWGELLDSVRTGRAAFDRAYGTGFFAYLTKHPASGETFHAAMAELAALHAPALLAVYDFSAFTRVVDVGGGSGALLAAILGAHPALRGVVFDSPEAIEIARERLAVAGLADHAEAVAGDFFESVPGGGDLYILRQIIHDWDDARAMRILTHCRHAMAAPAKLLIFEHVVPPGGGTSFAKLLDLNMIVISGGRERTEEEFRALLDAAGFRLARLIPTPAMLSVLEAAPARKGPSI
ncbi:MAG: methyltransferase [Acidobacteria bacterium]|nr:methyltransferase [Acidobacteriota bacterium]